MYYLHLKFTDAAIYLNNKKTLESEDYRKETLYQTNRVKTKRKVDLDNPINIHCVSNMLHCMFGLPPKPFYRETDFIVYDKIHDLAVNHTYLKLVSDNIYNHFGNKNYLFNFTRTSKSAYNSHQKGLTTIVGGEAKQGVFTWERFHSKFLDNEELYVIVILFFNELFGCKNVFKRFSFPELIEEIGKRQDDERLIAFKEKYGDVLRKQTKSGGWYDAAFNGVIRESTTCGNAFFSTKVPLLTVSGVAYKVYYSGELIVEIEDESLIDSLHKYGVLPTFLDGGVVDVLGCKKIPPMYDWKDVFTKIK